ncbi:cyclin-dependent kinase inhibitor 3 [Trichechus manatus latirostris]|uniref:Cyclin-dependent kinase inhibitor 3 n=1 Tax=Trichechus manatus latirostris TaxID=127582 RepID=A0A2Y9G5T4_TRIMA|nr:cyclin-dependent kinase inhibitor 3 [Trichechus manatus latirostris]
MDSVNCYSPKYSHITRCIFSTSVVTTDTSSSGNTTLDDLVPGFPNCNTEQWLPLSQVNCSQFLGLCALPGCKFKDIRRNIQKDTEELKNYGIQDIFVFCTRGELSKYRVPNLLDLYRQYGIITHHHPIPDGGTPNIASCCEIMEELAICLKNNRKTLIHCYGGLGRSCLVAACLLLYLSDTVSPQQAIDSLRDLRGSGAIQTIKQYNYLHEFRDKLAAHLSSREALSRSVSR